MYSYKQVLNFLLFGCNRDHENELLLDLAANLTTTGEDEATRTELQVRRELRKYRQKVCVTADAMVFMLPGLVLLFYLKMPTGLITICWLTKWLCSCLLAFTLAHHLHMVLVKLGLWCALRLAVFLAGLIVLSKATFDLVIPPIPPLGQYALTVVYFPVMFRLIPKQTSKIESLQTGGEGQL